MNASSLSFQDIILRLQQYWGEQGCVIMQPYDSEVGAGTFHTATTLRSLDPAEWRTCYAQPCRRPADGRYGENPNRMQHYYQFQVLIKPSPVNAQELYLGSLAAIGLDPNDHDVRFVEDDWESPTLGAWGLGGRSGLTVWRSRSLHTSSRWAVSRSTPCPSRSPMAWSVSPCTPRASTPFTT